VLSYPDVGDAIEWLCDAFGFTLRLRLQNYRTQLNVGDAAVLLTTERAADGQQFYSLIVRAENVDHHHERTSQHGARLLSPPADYPCGERQYSVEDVAGHPWTFSQSVADVDPEDWGGTPG
jgi:uncharacterized glyoxalase superfamily protein PhnB